LSPSVPQPRNGTPAPAAPPSFVTRRLPARASECRTRGRRGPPSAAGRALPTAARALIDSACRARVGRGLLTPGRDRGDAERARRSRRGPPRPRTAAGSPHPTRPATSAPSPVGAPTLSLRGPAGGPPLGLERSLLMDERRLRRLHRGEHRRPFYEAVLAVPGGTRDTWGQRDRSEGAADRESAPHAHGGDREAARSTRFDGQRVPHEDRPSAGEVRGWSLARTARCRARADPPARPHPAMGQHPPGQARKRVGDVHEAIAKLRATVGRLEARAGR